MPVMSLKKSHHPQKGPKTPVMSRKKSHHTQKEGENAGDVPEKVTSPAKRG